MISGNAGSGSFAAASAWVLAVLACVAAALALSATPALAAACPNEQLRKESSTDPSRAAEGKSYSEMLPECRAYEMVSPISKNEHSAVTVGAAVFNPTGPSGMFSAGFPVAPDGETAQFASSGGEFSGPENFFPLGGVTMVYQAKRETAGWNTSSATAPASLIRLALSEASVQETERGSGHYDIGNEFAPSLRGVGATCGFHTTEGGHGEYGNIVGLTCVVGKPGSWASTPIYPSLRGTSTTTEVGPNGAFLGASANLSRVFFQPNALTYLSADEPVSINGIYEVVGLGTQHPGLRLVNLDSSGKEIEDYGTSAKLGPLLGDSRAGAGIRAVGGSAYHAISQTGETVFFAAMPEGGVQTLYARVHCQAGSSSSCQPDPPHCVHSDENEATCKESPTGSGEWLETGNEEDFETVEVSHSQCTSCVEPAAQSATFQGASADGSKVFFTTEQELLNTDADTTMDLYEYDFETKKLTLVSEGTEEARKALLPGEGALVKGVVRTSPDGSHVYFVAESVLTTVPNKEGKKAEPPTPGRAANLYGYDTATHEIKFIAASNQDSGHGDISADFERHAQTTPDGKYLVFSSTAELAGAVGTKKSQAVYRYDFETGELVWISHAASKFVEEREAEHLSPNPEEGKNAWIAALPGTGLGGEPSIDDWNRAMSENGEYVIFTTTERLQAQDESKATQVYLWHNGAVSLISDGHRGKEQIESEADPLAAMSSSGSDIFFFTPTPLVKQDTDVVGDLYDARFSRTGANGEIELAGFPAPLEEFSCRGEGCQGEGSSPPPLGAAPSSVSPAGGNLTPSAGGTLGFKTSPPKPLTRAQKLAKALKACKAKRNKKRRVACESTARKKYAINAKAKKKVTAKKSDRRGA